MPVKRTEIRDIPGILSGRIGAGFLTGVGVLSSGVLDFASNLEFMEFGILGISLAGAGAIIAKSVSDVKRGAKFVAHKELGGAEIDLDTKDVAKVFFGLPAKEKRVYVNKGGMKAQPIKALPGSLNQLIPGTAAFVADLPEAQTFEEINNYVVLKNGKVYIEKIITPTSLAVWDEAFQHAGGVVTWSQAKPPRTVEDGLKSIINGFFKH